MSGRILIRVPMLIGLGLALVGSVAHAGYIETLGFGARSAAMGGAFTAVADTASAWYYNPAGLGQIDEDIQEVGLTQAVLIFGEQRGGVDGASGDETPTIYNVHFPSTITTGIDGLTVGLGGGVTWGQGLEWSQTEGDLRFSGYETSLFINTVSPAVGYRIGDTGFYIGVTWNVSALRQLENRQKLGDGFFTDAAVDSLGVDLPILRRVLDSRNGVDDGKLELSTDEEFPTGLRPTNTVDIDFEHFGYHVGVLWRKPGAPFSFGFTYRSEMDVTFDGMARIEFADDVKALVNQNPLLVQLNGGPIVDEAARFRFDVTFPRQIAVGLAWRPSERWLVAVDGTWTHWSAAWDQQVLELKGDGLLGITELPSDRFFEDTLSLRVGIEHRISSALSAQAGVWYDPSPVPKRTLDSGTSDGLKIVYSAGLSVRDALGRAFGLDWIDGLDVGTVVQVLQVPARRIEAGQSVNLGGTKRFESSVNDFDLEVSGVGVSFGLNVGYRF